MVKQRVIHPTGLAELQREGDLDPIGNLRTFSNQMPTKGSETQIEEFARDASEYEEP